MKLVDLVKYSINLGSDMCLGSLKDLSDKEMFHRPHPDSNHINWQVGHLILAEHNLIEKEFPGALPALPAGFAEKYAAGAAKKDDPKAFATKSELLAVQEQQRAAVTAQLDKLSDTDLARPLEGWCPHVASLFMAAAGEHWMMHVGQWAVIRRQLGRPPMF